MELMKESQWRRYTSPSTSRSPNPDKYRPFSRTASLTTSFTTQSIRISTTFHRELYGHCILVGMYKLASHVPTGQSFSSLCTHSLINWSNTSRFQIYMRSLTGMRSLWSTYGEQDDVAEAPPSSPPPFFSPILTLSKLIKRCYLSPSPAHL